MTRVALVVLGLGLVGASWFVPVEPFEQTLPGGAVVHPGGNTLEAWWVGAAGAALIVAGWAASRGGRAAAGGGLLAGLTAASLGLTHPLWLQRPLLANDERTQPLVLLALGLIAVQGAVVVWLLKGRIRRTLGAAMPWLSWWRGPVALVLLVACAAHVTPYEPKGYWASYAINVIATVGTWLLALGALVVFATARAPTGGMAGEGREASVAFPWVCAVFVGGFAAATNWYVLDGVPHIPDGIAYLFQAKTFAAGRLAFDAPPLVDHLEVYLMDVVDGRWFAVTPPGWPAVLAIGECFGAAWLVNPILGGLTIPVAHALTRRLSNRRTADLLTVLLTTSPWLLFLSASFMTHAISLLDVLLAWLLILQVRDGMGRWRGFAAGALMGHLFLVRPLDGVLVGGLTGILILIAFRRRRFETAVLYGFGCAAVGALVFAYNDAIAGGPFDVPIQAYTDRIWYPGANALGFGPDVGNPPDGWGILDPHQGHGAIDVALNTNQNLYNLNFELFGWAVGGLLPAVLHLLRGRWDRRDAVAAVLLVLLLAIYNLYWFSGGPDYGARYWYLMLFPVAWLSVRGVGTLINWAETRWPGADAAGRVRSSIALLCLISIFVFLPWRLVARYDGYRTFHAGYRDLIESGELTNEVVLVHTTADVDYACAFLCNDPAFPPDRPIFLRYLGPQSAAAARQAFPGRTVIEVNGPAGRREAVRIGR